VGDTMSALLLLEDGQRFWGRSAGAPRESFDQFLTLMALQTTVAAIRYLRTRSLGIGSLDSKYRGLSAVPGTSGRAN